MALISVVGGLWIPNPIQFGVSTPGFTSLLMDASGERVAFCGVVPKTGTLDKFEFRVGTVAVAAGSQVRASFQDVSLTNGDPDGTQDQFRDTAGSSFSSNSWIVPGLITSDGTDTGTKRSVTRGDLIACVIEYQTFTTGDSINVSALDLGSATSEGRYSYSDLFTASWAKQFDPLCAVLKYDDGTYGSLDPVRCSGVSGLNHVAFNSGSTPDERGLIFRFPVSVKVGAAWVWVEADADSNLVLYDSDGTTALETILLDANVDAGVGAGGQVRVFTQERELKASTDYRLVVKPTTTSNVGLSDFDVGAAAIMDAFHGGQNWQYTQRTDAGAWTETTTKRAYMALLVTAIGDGCPEAAIAQLANSGGMVGLMHV